MVNHYSNQDFKQLLKTFLNHHSKGIHVFKIVIVVVKFKQLLPFNTNSNEGGNLFLFLIVKHLKVSPKFSVDIQHDGEGIFQLFQAILISDYHLFEHRRALVVGDHEKVEVFPWLHVENAVLLVQSLLELFQLLDKVPAREEDDRIGELAQADQLQVRVSQIIDLELVDPLEEFKVHFEIFMVSTKRKLGFK